MGASQTGNTASMSIQRSVAHKDTPRFRAVVAKWLGVSKDLSKEGLLGVLSGKASDPKTAAKYSMAALEKLLVANKVPFTEKEL